MALSSSGNLLVRVEAPHIDQFSLILDVAAVGLLPGYSMEPLIPASPTATFGLSLGTRWMLAKPSAIATDSPWDQAHQAAASVNYAHYVEPDIVHAMPTAASGEDIDSAWPPKAPPSPGWHLDVGFTGFSAVRAVSTGKGVRIAHLDTATPPDTSQPPKTSSPTFALTLWTTSLARSIRSTARLEQSRSRYGHPRASCGWAPQPYLQRQDV